MKKAKISEINFDLIVLWVLFIGRILLEIWCQFADILYLYWQDFAYISLRSSMIFFLFASPFIQMLTWMFQLSYPQIQLNEEEKQNQISNAKGTFDLILVEFKWTLKYYYWLFKIAITKIPLSIMIALAQSIKIFPFILFVYTYKKYKIIITDDMMNSLKQQWKIEKEEKKDIQELQNNDKQDNDQLDHIIRQSNAVINNRTSFLPQQDQFYFNRESKAPTVIQNVISNRISESNNSQAQGIVSQFDRSSIAGKKYSRPTSVQQKLLNDQRQNSYDKLIDEQQFNDRNSEYQGKKNVNLCLDSNMEPNFQTILLDSNLQKFMIMADVIEAMFKALPMCVIQFINNEERNSWVHKSDNTINLFILSVFLISALSVVIHLIWLQRLLYGDGVEVFFQTMKFLNDTKQKDKSENKQKSWKGIGNIYPVPTQLKVNDLTRLKKVSILSKSSAKRIKNITIAIPPDRRTRNTTCSLILHSLPLFEKLASLSLSLEGQMLKDNQMKSIINVITDQLNNIQNIDLIIGKNAINAEFQNKIRQKMEKIEKRVQTFSLLGDDFFKFVTKDQNQKVLQMRIQQIINKSYCLNKIQIRYQKIIAQKADLKQIIKLIQNQQQIQHLQINLGQIQRSSAQEISFYIKKMKYLQKCLFKAGNILVIKNSEKLVLDQKQLMMQMEKRSLLYDYARGVIDPNPGKLPRIQMAPIMQQAQIIDIKPEQINNSEVNIIMDDKKLNEKHFQSMIQNLQRLPDMSILNLDFSKNVITQYDSMNIFDSISQQTQLNVLILNLQFSKIYLQGALSLSNRISQLQRLVKLKLNLVGNKITSEGSQAIFFSLGRMANLQYLSLNLSNNLLNQNAFSKLGDCLNDQNKITYLNLDLSWNKIENEGLIFLFKNIKSIKSLKSFKMVIINVIKKRNESKVWKFLADFLKINQNISNLDINLGLNQIMNEDIIDLSEGLAGLAKLKQIHFSFYRNKISDSSLIIFIESFINLGIVTHFSLNTEDNSITGQFVKSLSNQIQKMNNLEYLSLNISRCDVDFSCLTQLNKSLGYAQKIQFLDLNFYYNNLSFSSIQELSNAIQVMNNLNILKINLSKTLISYEEVIQLCNIIEEKVELKELILGLSNRNSINQNSGKHVAQDNLITVGISQTLNKLINLQYLDLNLDYQSINNEGCCSIFEGIKALSQLQFLRISLKGNNIGIKGGYGICQFIENLKSLIRLDLNLSHNQLENLPCIRLIYKLKNMVKLMQADIYLSGNLLNQNGIDVINSVRRETHNIFYGYPNEDQLNENIIKFLVM
ncbi:hypothetical protein ABPG72_001210 [Tetrahymena utriculariae]